MPVFKCDKCGCMENTATSNGWDQLINKKPMLCSECDPEIGRWHGRFKKCPAPEPFPEDAELRATYGHGPSRAKCLACGIEKDMDALEKYPYAEEEGIIDDPIPPLFDLDCEPASKSGVWKKISVCHECFHKLSHDMWTSEECWIKLNPVTPFDQLPNLPDNQDDNQDE